MKTEPLATLERETRRIIEQLKLDKTIAILGDDGTPAAYLVDPLTYIAPVERMQMLEAVALGESDVAAGRTLTHSQVKERMGKWLK